MSTQLEIDFPEVPKTASEVTHEMAEGLEYDCALGLITWPEPVSIRIGNYQLPVCADELLQSLAPVVLHRLLQPVLSGSRSEITLPIDDTLAMRIRHVNGMATIAIEPVGWRNPHFKYCEATPVSLISVRDRIAEFVAWAIGSLEQRHAWLKERPRRTDLLLGLSDLEHTEVTPVV